MKINVEPCPLCGADPYVGVLSAHDWGVCCQPCRLRIARSYEGTYYPADLRKKYPRDVDRQDRELRLRLVRSAVRAWNRLPRKEVPPCPKTPKTRRKKAGP